MRELRPCELTDPSFCTLGAWHDMLRPEWESIGDGKTVDFYRDILSLKLGQAAASFSVCHARARDPVVDTVEYHTSAEEAILPLNADIAMILAPATSGGSVPLDKMKAYRIPRGTMVILKAGAWHGGPHVVGTAAAHILVALPERTYANDCIVKQLAAADRIRIAGP